MVIYKFGGASVKNREAFYMLRNIVSACPDPLVVVVSAMDKTTNKLEEIVKHAVTGVNEYRNLLAALGQYHIDLAVSLMPDEAEPVRNELDGLFHEVDERIALYKSSDFNLFYDQVVSMGEVISTHIVSRFLQYEKVDNQWIDIRGLLITDDNYRDAAVNFEVSADLFRQAVTFNSTSCYITQGFIGSAENGKNTTLGREGSDYTAAVLADIFDARSVTLWKDVAGIYNADPAVFTDVIPLDRINYQEMIELAYYGAKVIHPKTIKPLRVKNIPLYVKSFYDPEGTGTSVGDYPDYYVDVPIIILMHRQVLISISLSDLSFISESHISKFFALLNRFRLKANLMQHSAISFSVSVDEPRGREVQDLIGILRKEFRVLYNEGLTLITIRHYTEASIKEQIAGKKIFVEQRSRSTVQYLVG